jgi:predicted site-specific integrase-resolvase
MTTMTLPRFLPLSEAAQELGLSEAELRKQVEAGTITAATVNGEIVVSEESLPQKKEDLPEYNSKLEGIRISISDAAREYGIPTGTITRWMQRGIVKRLDSDGYRTLIDKADIDYCAKIYQKSGSQGRRLFNSDGTPYRPKSNPLAG